MEDVGQQRFWTFTIQFTQLSTNRSTIDNTALKLLLSQEATSASDLQWYGGEGGIQIGLCITEHANFQLS